MKTTIPIEISSLFSYLPWLFVSFPLRSFLTLLFLVVYSVFCGNILKSDLIQGFFKRISKINNIRQPKDLTI